MLQYHPKGSSSSSGKKGWFGKKKGYGNENGAYNRSASEIADRYRPRGGSANVELPNAYYNRK